MSARKFAEDVSGQWQRDECSLPSYRLDPGKLPRLCPPLRHALSTGRLTLLADQHGTVQLFTAETGAPCCLTVPGPAVVGAFLLRLVTAAGIRTVMPADLAPGTEAAMHCGIGTVCFGDKVVLDPGMPVAVAIEFLAPPGQSFVVCRLCLTNDGPHTAHMRVEAFMDVNPGPETLFPSAERRHFLGEGVAMRTDCHERLGDVYLAGDDGWTAAAAGQRLALHTELTIDAGHCAERHLLLGFGTDCSVEWLRQQREKNLPGVVREAWGRRLAAARLRAPELWMQEECLWGVGRTLACAVTMPATGPVPVIVAGGETLFAPGLPRGQMSAGFAVRDLLQLSLPLSPWAADLALANLRAATMAQARSGRLPETLGAAPAAHIDSERDRSDLEIWLLVAWSVFAATQPAAGACLDAPCRFADGGEASVWEHLRAAYLWIRDEIREGSRGLLRILAGDANGLLNRVGIEGKGESVLNSAMVCFALQRLVELARRRDDTRLADDMDAWWHQQKLAVGEAFDGGFFRRAYTDAGRPLGTVAEGRIFTDAQAWAVLARCGTADQRRQALASTLERQKHDPALTTLSPPYPLPSPADVSALALAPGDGENGGVSLAVAAWFIGALAQEGRKEEALAEWRRLAVHRRAAESADLPALLLSNLEWLASDLAGRRTGGPARAMLADMTACLPNAHAGAWLDYALRRILS